ncbi:MAG: peptidoglycan DD-metalloendopeptidase family protein [candidate division KSB1 bacterium]|nr:peptidoglycan DD-metalloendopeptidase family protein [candidate division KSB1 bacterium]
MVSRAQAGRAQNVDALRQKIRDLEAKIREKVNQEAQTLDVIEAIDQKISLTKNLLLRLQAEVERHKAELDSLRALRQENAYRLEKLKSLVARRMVNLYKYGRISAIESLLRTHSFRYLQLWIDYQKQLNQNDARNLRNYRQRHAELLSTQQQIEANLAEQVKLLQEKRQEERKLQDSREEKKKLLKKLLRDRRMYERQLQDYQKAIEEIQRLIASSEQERLKKAENQPNAAPDGSFVALKGQLPWPVEGEVVRAYGPYQHPVLKTVTNNLGIDISAPLGTEVRAVAAGRVTAITWQRGRGNLIIINHGEGFYTVYTHLNEIYVNLQEDVAEGQVIGRVGETGTFDRPVLHFQIWEKFNHLDPEAWLKPR